jgi:hypothetical protein
MWFVVISCCRMPCSAEHAITILLHLHKGRRICRAVAHNLVEDSVSVCTVIKILCLRPFVWNMSIRCSSAGWRVLHHISCCYHLLSSFWLQLHPISSPLFYSALVTFPLFPYLTLPLLYHTHVPHHDHAVNIFKNFDGLLHNTSK